MYTNVAATSATPEGPFTNPKSMSNLKYAYSKDGKQGWDSGMGMGDFGFFVDQHGADADGFPSAYLIYNCRSWNSWWNGKASGMSTASIVVEKLNDDFTDGGGWHGTEVSGNLRELSAGAGAYTTQESPAMYRSPKGKYVVMTAGATCFGMPQPEAAPWGGTGIFAYVSPSPLGPYEYFGNINNRDGNLSDTNASTACGMCPSNSPPFACQLGNCALPVQLNSIARKHDGSPLGLTGSTWALKSDGAGAAAVTNVLGDYGEYWQPWELFVDENGLPKPLVFHRDISLDTNITIHDQ